MLQYLNSFGSHAIEVAVDKIKLKSYYKCIIKES